MAKANGSNIRDALKRRQKALALIKRQTYQLAYQQVSFIEALFRVTYTFVSRVGKKGGQTREMWFGLGLGLVISELIRPGTSLARHLVLLMGYIGKKFSA